jgi:glycosyltransferase involved in cell wall biosynthesis
MRAVHVAAGNLYGGVERILVEIASAPPGASQHEFAVCFDGRLLAELRQAHASCHVLGAVRFSRPISVWCARRKLNQFLADSSVDALICHSPWAYALAAPCAKAPQRILWAHNALTGAHWTERRVSRTPPHLVVCNSRYTATAVATRLPSTPRQVVYPPVAPKTHPADTRVHVRRELAAADGTTVVLIASRLEPMKGHVALLQAACGLHGDWMMWVAGGAQRPPEVALETELRSFAATYGLGERVRFLGERADVPRLLRGADVFCQPNTSPEPFGVVFAEALAAGVPIVTSDAGGAREIVTAECGVLLPMGDVGALRESLQTLIDDLPRRMVLGAAGPQRAHAICDPATQMASLERVLVLHAQHGQEALA